jgi:ATP-dependent RNA helicase DeaD
MHNDTNMDNEKATQEGETANTEVKHRYYEVGGDLLSKPNALCDVLESVPEYKTSAIFCNTPSEADLIEVILKKRNIAAKKLIGHIPPSAVSAAVREARQGELRCLVVTDVAARELEVEDLDLVVNYSIPNDPEVYIHRMGRDGHGGSSYTIISLVGPSDITSFHYLKKIGGFEMEQLAPPSEEDMLKARVEKMAQEALNFEAIVDERTRKFLEAINAHQKRDQLILWLTHNTLNVIPEMQSREESREIDSTRRHGRARQGDTSGGRERTEKRSRRFDEERGEPRREREERKPQKVSKKEIRVYLGLGQDDNFSEAKLSELLKSSDELSDLSFTRSIVRNKYSFFDFPIEKANGLEDKLSALSLEGENLFIKKATVISVPLSEEEMDALRATNGGNFAGSDELQDDQERAESQEERLES